MVKITWLGEDELHDGGAGPSFVTWRTIKFPKGVAVDVSNNEMIEGARANQYFDVEGPDEFVSTHTEPKRRGRPPKVKEEDNVDG